LVNLAPECCNLTLLMELCRFDIAENDVNRIMKAVEMTSTFFMMDRVSDEGKKNDFKAAAAAIDMMANYNCKKHGCYYVFKPV
jgi:hypothetical protein